MKKLICLIVALLLLPLMACTHKLPKPTKYDWPQPAEVQPPKPSEYDNLLIRKPHASTGFLVTDPEKISAIEQERIRILDIDDHGHYFMWPNDSNLDYEILAFGGGWQGTHWPFHKPEEVEALANAVNNAITSSISVELYYFLANDPHKHAETMADLNSHDGLHAYYPEYSLTSQYSYISLAYSYDNTKAKYEGGDILSNDTPLGKLACDDVFIPIVDYVREKSMLYELPPARCQIYGTDGFMRELKIYLNDPISVEESRYIEEMWLKQQEKEPYSSPVGYEYKEITQYPIFVLSEQPLSEMRINELEKIYNLNLVVKNPLPFQYLDSSSYDTSYILTNEGYVMDKYFNWEHIETKESLEKTAERHKFVFNHEIDFDKYDIIISFGREILEMQTVIPEYGYFEYGQKDLTVSFSNRHCGNEVFFYQIPKTILSRESPYSIIDNGEEIESGLSVKNANEIMAGFQRGF